MTDSPKFHPARILCYAVYNYVFVIILNSLALFTMVTKYTPMLLDGRETDNTYLACLLQ